MTHGKKKNPQKISEIVPLHPARVKIRQESLDIEYAAAKAHESERVRDTYLSGGDLASIESNCVCTRASERANLADYRSHPLVTSELSLSLSLAVSNAPARAPCCPAATPGAHALATRPAGVGVLHTHTHTHTHTLPILSLFFSHDNIAQARAPLRTYVFETRGHPVLPPPQQQQQQHRSQSQRSQ